MATQLNRMVFYCPDDLKEKLEKLAKEENRSLSNLVVTLLQRIVEEKDEDKNSSKS